MKLWVFSGRYAWRLELGQSTDTRAAGSGGEEATGITTSPQRRADWSLSLRSLKCRSWDFSAVQWLRLHASIAGGTGSIPGWATQIPYGAAAQKNKTKQNKTKPKTQTTCLLLFSPHTSIILSCCSPVWNVFWSPLLSKSNKFLPNVKFKFLFSEVFQANTTVSPLLAFIIGASPLTTGLLSSSTAKMLNRSLLSVQQNKLYPFIYSFMPQIEHLTSWVRSRITNPLTWRSLGLDWG